jgi:hypothetical protein
MVRMNTRITKAMQTFIKTKAKKENLTEGDVVRLIISYYIIQKK